MAANARRRLNQTLKNFLDSSEHERCNFVLATIVATVGSTYRKTGAQMLVHANSERAIGILSGGCLEDEIVKAARQMLAAPASDTTATQLMFFDLMPEGDFLVGYGQGCSGQLTVLLERFPPALVAFVAQLVEPLQPLAVALIFEAGGAWLAGDRLVLRADGQHFGTARASDAEQAELLAILASVMQSRKPMAYNLNCGAKAAIFAVKPPLDLLVFGAGPDAPALVALAEQLGWQVRVCDHRAGRLEAAEFSSATQRVLYDPQTLGDELVTSKDTAVVIMTHNLLVDAEILKWAAQRRLAYLGLLGPKHRFERILRWLRSQGTELNPLLYTQLHTPIGLDLGGDGGEWDIALEVVAQIQRLKNGASAQHRSMKHATDLLDPAVCESNRANMILGGASPCDHTTFGGPQDA